MCPELHSFLKTCTETSYPGFFANGDPARPSDPHQPAGYRPRRDDQDKPNTDASKHVAPSYEDEEDDEDEDEDDDEFDR